jgi:hypothetical protein
MISGASSSGTSAGRQGLLTLAPGRIMNKVVFGG